MSMPTFRKALLAASLALLGAASAQAAIVGYSGAVTVLGASPVSLLEGALESDTTVHAFNERQGLTLASALSVDFVPPSFTSAGSIAAGTRISSHIIHFDSVDGGRSPTGLTGSVTFDGQILGLIFNDPRLNATDSLLGAPGTAYPGGVVGRRFLFSEGSDVFSISGGQLTFNFTSFVSDGFIDQMRIVTAAVPTPGSLALAGLGLLALGASARARRAA